MEYRIITHSPAELQKLLNQWKHEYTLNIISTHIFQDTDKLMTLCILTRTKKDVIDVHRNYPEIFEDGLLDTSMSPGASYDNS